MLDFKVSGPNQGSVVHLLLDLKNDIWMMPLLLFKDSKASHFPFELLCMGRLHRNKKVRYCLNHLQC